MREGGLFCGPLLRVTERAKRQAVTSPPPGPPSGALHTAWVDALRGACCVRSSCAQVWDPRAARRAPAGVLPALVCLGEVSLFLAGHLKLASVFNTRGYRGEWYRRAALPLR